MTRDRSIQTWCWVKPKDGETVPDYPPVEVTIVQFDPATGTHGGTMTQPKILLGFTQDDIYGWSEEERNLMLQWAEVNGLNPLDVRAEIGFTIEDIDGRHMIRYQRFIRSEAGSVQIIPGTDDQLSVEELEPMLFVPPAFTAWGLVEEYANSEHERPDRE